MARAVSMPYLRPLLYLDLCLICICTVCLVGIVCIALEPGCNDIVAVIAGAVCKVAV